MRHPLLVRAVAIAAVAFAILLPIELIRGKVAERQARAQAVVSTFAAQASGPQVIVGPFLALTCEDTYEEEREVKRAGKADTIREWKVGPCATEYFAPATFDARADVPVQTLHRGIYPIRTYRATVQWRGEIAWPAPAESAAGHKRRWKQAYLVSHVRDPRGIKAIASATASELLDGAGEPSLQSFNIRESLGDYESRVPGTRLAFAYEATLAGIGSFEIAPVGDRSEIRMASDWPHPSFGAAWSPDERAVSRDGFSAVWRINSVATGGNAMWMRLAAAGKIGTAQGAGAAMYDPVNVYTLSYRATEYAFLFVLFTFAAFAALEVLAGVRLHPVQYGLVGCALAVFFLLVLALSEHVAFAAAYAAAALACSALIAFYLRVPLGSRPRASAAFAGFATMYATLYGMLQSEDNALLMGSLLVFAALAAIMVGTRRLDWERGLTFP